MQALICIKPSTTSQGGVGCSAIRFSIARSAPVRRATNGKNIINARLENYFMLTGNGAVTLMGLLFVIVTLGVDRA